jgi:hypothetical protein
VRVPDEGLKTLRRRPQSRVSVDHIDILVEVTRTGLMDKSSGAHEAREIAFLVEKGYNHLQELWKCKESISGGIHDK